MSNDKMVNNTLDRKWKEPGLWQNLWHYSGFFLEGQRKHTKNLTQHRYSPGWDSNLRLVRVKKGTPFTQPQSSVIIAVHSKQNIQFHAYSHKLKNKQPGVPGFITHERVSKQFLPVSQPAPSPLAFCDSEPPKLELSRPLHLTLPMG